MPSEFVLVALHVHNLEARRYLAFSRAQRRGQVAEPRMRKGRDGAMRSLTNNTGSKVHINRRILQTMVSGIPLVLGLGAEM